MPTQIRQTTHSGAADQVEDSAVRGQDLLTQELWWVKSNDPQYPYATSFEGTICTIRLNDFPDESLYTLLVGDEAIDFDDWPAQWRRPE